MADHLPALAQKALPGCPILVPWKPMLDEVTLVKARIFGLDRLRIRMVLATDQTLRGEKDENFFDGMARQEFLDFLIDGSIPVTDGNTVGPAR